MRLFYPLSPPRLDLTSKRRFEVTLGNRPLNLSHHRPPNLRLRVWNVNLLSHKRVGVALQATVQRWGQTSTNGATSLQRPLFWLTVHTFTLVSASLQRPLCSVPKVAVVDRFNCKILRSANAKYQFYLFFYKILK